MVETRTLKAAMNQVAEWNPDETAFVQGAAARDRRITYGAANEEGRRFATGLSRLGVGPGDRVAFLSRTTVEHAVAYLATVKLGAIPASLHWREAPNVLAAMLERIEPSAVVADPRFVDAAAAASDGVGSVEHLVCLDALDEPATAEADHRYTDVVAEAPAEEPAVEVGPDDVAFLNFSSGTTGVPKPIVHTHHDAVEAAQIGAYKYGIRKDDVALKTATPSFIAWANATFSYVNAGATLVYLDRSAPETVLSAVEDEGVTAVVMAPTLWRRLLDCELAEHDLSSVRRAGYGGGPISPSLFARIRDEVASEVATHYGTTETMTSSVVLFPAEITESNLDSVGRPAPNVDLRIVESGTGDPDARVDRGEPGEVLIRGPAVAEAVWDDPESTAELFDEDGWFYTGDLGYVGEDGNLYLLGRADNVIVTGGIKVHPERVETVLSDHPGVGAVAVVGVPDEEWGEAVEAFVVPAAGSLDEATLDAFCRASDDLADYQRPRHYEFVDALPRTGTNKISRRELGDR